MHLSFVLGFHFIGTLRCLIDLINACGVTFTVWEKKDGEGKGIGKMDWTSLMGDEKKKVLRYLPSKLQESTEAIDRTYR